MNNKDLVEAFFLQERGRRKKFTVIVWSVVIVTDICLLLAYVEGVSVFRILRFLTVPAAVCLVLLWISLYRDKTLQERLGVLLDGIEFGWEELNGLDLNPKEADYLHHAFAVNIGARVSMNAPYLRTRGTDEKGPAFDKSEAQVDASTVRVDPSLHEADYEGLEGELRVSEQLVAEANQHYAQEAQRQWDIAEQRDMDMVEAGVERLGDLVASGWFEQNPADGALSALMETAEDGDEP